MQQSTNQVSSKRKSDNQKKDLRSLILILAMALCLTLVYLAGAIQYGATDEKFFDKTFTKLESQAKTGLNDEDFEAVKQKLIDYVGLKTQEFSVPVTIDGQRIDFFNERERAHMIDVQNLFVLNDRILKGALILLLALYGLGRFVLKRSKLLIEALSISGLLMMTLMFLFGLIVSQDFNAAFIKFHELFFSNDLWLLDPATDRMIVLLEEQFFNDIALHIGLYTVLLAMLGTAVGVIGRHNAKS